MPDKRHTRHFIPAEDAIPQIYFESPEGDGIVASDALRSDSALALLNKDDYAYPHSVGAKVSIVVEVRHRSRVTFNRQCLTWF